MNKNYIKTLLAVVLMTCGIQSTLQARHGYYGGGWGRGGWGWGPGIGFGVGLDLSPSRTFYVEREPQTIVVQKESDTTDKDDEIARLKAKNRQLKQKIEKQEEREANNNEVEA